MKNILIVSTIPIVKNNSSTVINRNCYEISKYLKCDYVSSGETIKLKQYDLIIFAYSSFYFQFKPFMTLLEAQKNCKVGWITNEYNITPNGCFKDKIEFTISNFENTKYPNNLSINLNTLIYMGRNPEVKKKYNAVYYGTYRTGREKYFIKYLQDEVMLSTSEKNKKKFKVLGCNPTYISKFNFLKKQETLNLFEKSLYIEDEKTHTLYNYLANRFYEAINCNALPLFDRSCENTIKKSGYYIPDEFIIDSIEDLKNRKIDPTLREQFLIVNDQIALKERAETLSRIKDFLLNL